VTEATDPPALSVHERLTHWNEATRDKVALAFPDDDQEVTYGELCSDVARMANLLKGLEGRRSARVAIYLPNQYELVVTWLAADVAGLIECPLNFFLGPSAIAGQIELIEPAVIVADAVAWAAVPYSGNAHVVEVGALDPPPPGQRVQVEGLYDQAADLSAFDVEHHVNSDVVSILGTSGTTGRPKGAMVSRHYASETARTFQRLSGASSNDVLYNPLSLWHGNTQYMAVLAALDLGASAVIPRKFSASRFWDQVARSGATIVNYHASMLGILLKRGVAGVPSHNVRLVVGGGAAALTVLDFQRATSIEVLELYGLTEFMLSLSNRRGDYREGSCGQVTPNFQGMLVDVDDNPVPIGVEGELVLRPNRPLVSFSGYWNNPAAMVQATRNLWFHTGDIFVQDAEGYLYFRDRAGNFIRKSGENVAADSIERVALLHRQVDYAAAVGVPGDFADEEIKLVIVTQGELMLPELIALLEAELPPYAVPRFIELRDSLPVNSSLRVQKGELRAGAAGRVVDIRALTTAGGNA
jgi:crotonobetaine/carnitine-CoA ligase